MKTTHRTLNHIALLALFATTTTVLRAEPAGIIARVDGEDVPVGTLKPFFEDLSERDRTALEANPALLNQTVRNVILRRLLMKEALATGWDKRPEVLERIERAQEAVVLESYIREITKPPSDFPTDKQIADLYEAGKGELVIPEQVELAQIYVPLPRDADKVQTAAARALVDQVKAGLAAQGAEFLDVAQEMAARGPVRGGALGLLALDSLQPEVREVVAPLAKGAVTPPIELADGFYFVKVLDRKPSRMPPLDEVKDRLADVLREQRARQNLDAYLARLQQQHPVSINELSLEAVLKKSAQ
jgi:parvulin-like peptidyl-prolyl isomerase